jgi:membrane protein DedA with SNARE-associated domain
MSDLSPRPELSNAETSNHFRGRPLPKVLPYVLFGIVVALTVVGTITGGAAPELLKNHPLLLILGAPRYRWIVAVAPKVSAMPLILISWVRLLASDPVYFLIGWYYGDKAMMAFESLLGKQAMDTTRRMFERATWVLSAFAAGPIICALAGLARINPKRFFTLDVAGTLAIAVLLRVFAETLKSPLQHLIDFNAKYSRYLLVITVVFMVITFARSASRFKALRSEVDKLSDSQ